MDPFAVIEDILDQVENLYVEDIPLSDDGELVIHTGIYKWSNGSYHCQSEKMQLKHQQTSTPEEKPK
jgi:hypothetical protein